MSENIKSLGFALLVCIVCSTLLTAASIGFKKKQIKNIEVDKQKNILKSIGLIHDQQAYSATQVEKLYDKNIKMVWIDAAGRIVPETEAQSNTLPIYLYINNNQVDAYIVPINTRGLWGKIKGYLSLEKNGTTIRGFTVYSHAETPGLGGEIEKKWFQKNFKGKKITNQDGQMVSITIAKGTVKDSVPIEKQIHYVDGISGATLTGKYLTSGLKQILSQYEPISIKFRQNKIDKLVTK